MRARRFCFVDISYPIPQDVLAHVHAEPVSVAPVNLAPGVCVSVARPRPICCIGSSAVARESKWKLKAYATEKWAS